LLTAVGVAVGVLFAPKSGKKTRRLLKSQTNNFLRENRGG